MYKRKRGKKNVTFGDGGKKFGLVRRRLRRRGRRWRRDILWPWFVFFLFLLACCLESFTLNNCLDAYPELPSNNFSSLLILLWFCCLLKKPMMMYSEAWWLLWTLVDTVVLFDILAFLVLTRFKVWWCFYWFRFRLGLVLVCGLYGLCWFRPWLLWFMQV